MIPIQDWMPRPRVDQQNVQNRESKAVFRRGDWMVKNVCCEHHRGNHHQRRKVHWIDACKP